MSALTSALAAYASKAPSVDIMEGSAVADDDESPSASSPDPYPRQGLVVFPSRRNEHLAVLLPKNLWKHCRKCGGVFCKKCTARTTPLLDTSNLDFLHPPRNMPLEAFESPQSPILPGKVCDDCWEQLNGYPTPRTPRTPELIRSSPLSMKKAHSSEASSLASSVSTPPNGQPVMPKRVVRGTRTCPQLPHVRIRSSLVKRPETVPEVTTPPADHSLGELATYPLRKSSALCKATGGGRWCPKESLNVGFRIPGCKAAYEIEMEREEEEARMRHLNPIIQDGEFRYRFIRKREDEKPSIATSPFHIPCHFSTF
ncbi:hypothetical protein HWV62_38468 [Athelia sp. TMB]|nr:hypothetical protein HWV62_38468 [Athelia sp. TMB]